MIITFPQFEKKTLRTVILALCLFAAALLPRSIGLGRFFTADELGWMERSWEFWQALGEGRINDTLQTTHPGITTMWLAGGGMRVKALLSNKSFSYAAAKEFLPWAQAPIAAVNALAVVGVFLLARGIWGQGIAWWAALFWALNPFHISLSRLVHVDALLASFMALAFLSLCGYWISVRRGQKTGRWLGGSIIFAALAILTKVPALYLLPVAGVVFLTARRAAHAWKWKQGFVIFLLWLLGVGLLVLIGWPALIWVPDPTGNVLLVKRDVVRAVTIPHHMVEEYRLRPWHYPATILARTTPLTLFAALGGLIWLVVNWWRRRKVSSWRGLALFLFLLGFIALMTAGAKKGDRYILPVFWIIDLAAAWALIAAGSWMVRKLALRRKWLSYSFVLLGAGWLGWYLWTLHPYYLAHYNKIFRPNLSQSLGWGEGYEQVAQFFNKLPGAEGITVAAWYPDELNVLTKATVLHINAHNQGKVAYVVLYRNMFGRPPDHWANDFIDEYYRKRRPVFTASVNGLPYAWVYAKRRYPHVVGELRGSVKLMQTFRSKFPHLTRIDVLMANYRRKNTADLVFSLRRHPRDQENLRTVVVNAEKIKDNNWHAFRFSPLPDSAGKTYTWVLESPEATKGNAVTVWATDRPYEEGEMYVFRSKNTTWQQARKPGALAFRVYYLVDGRERIAEEIELRNSQK